MPMKQSRHFLFLLLASALLAACSVDEQPQVSDGSGLHTMTFTAVAPQTRTVLLPGEDGIRPVYWSDGDAIAVYPQYSSSDGSPALASKSTFVTSIPDGTAATATFTGTAYYGYQYMAFYPDKAILASNKDMMIPFLVPTEQAAIPGTFAPDTNPAYAIAVPEGGQMSFMNVGALVKFSISGVDDLSRIVLRAEGDGALLTGVAWFSFKNAGISYESDYGFAAYNWAALKGDIETGKDYYLVVCPFALTASDRLSLTFVKADGSRTVKSVTGRELKLEAGHIADLGTIDLSSAAFERIIDNLGLIELAEDCYVNELNWTKNDDGSVTVNEANLPYIESVSALSGFRDHGITDLSGIEYFTNLRNLEFSAAEVPSADVSKLTNLVYLTGNGSNLTSLTLGYLPYLQSLRCATCYLTSLDIRGVGDQLTTLKCGGQTNGTLTLTLTPAQKEKWDESWSADPSNSNVVLDVREMEN